MYNKHTGILFHLTVRHFGLKTFYRSELCWLSHTSYSRRTWDWNVSTLYL